MGSWCETCGITQLPINYGDKIRVFALVGKDRQMKGGGCCYSDDIWSPIGPAIQGTYDDYGGVENIVDNEEARLVLARLKKGWLPFESTREKVTPLVDMALEEAFHWIERGEAKLKEPLRKEEPLGIFFVLEDVYQAMIKFDMISTSHDYDAHIYIYEPMSKSVKSRVEKWYRSMMSQHLGIKDLPQNDMRRLISATREIVDEQLFDWRDSGGTLFRNTLRDQVSNGLPFEDPQVQTICNALCDYFRFQGAVVMARKTWTPQSGKGSQDSDDSMHSLLAKVTLEIIKARYDHYREENETSSVNEDGYMPWMLEHNAEVKGESNGNQKK